MIVSDEYLPPLPPDITALDVFAMAALQIVRPMSSGNRYSADLAAEAYDVAEAMMAEKASRRRAEELVYKAFQQAGEFIPQTPDEVEAAEAVVAAAPESCGCPPIPNPMKTTDR